MFSIWPSQTNRSSSIHHCVLGGVSLLWRTRASGCFCAIVAETEAVCSVGVAHVVSCCCPVTWTSQDQSRRNAPQKIGDCSSDLGRMSVRTGWILMIIIKRKFAFGVYLAFIWLVFSSTPFAFSILCVCVRVCVWWMKWPLCCCNFQPRKTRLMSSAPNRSLLVQTTAQIEREWERQEDKVKVGRCLENGTEIEKWWSFWDGREDEKMRERSLEISDREGGRR